MFPHNQISSAAIRLAEFLASIDEVPGVNLTNLTYKMPVQHDSCPDLMAIESSTAGTTMIFKEFSHLITGAPDQKEIMESVRAAREMNKRQAGMKAAQDLVTEVAANGSAFIENVPGRIIDMFLKIWCDAYGEDSPDLFLRKCGEAYTGYIKTHLTSEEIAAMKNEDGDDNYQPEPLFPANMIKEDKPNA